MLINMIEHVLITIVTLAFANAFEEADQCFLGVIAMFIFSLNWLLLMTKTFFPENIYIS